MSNKLILSSLCCVRITYAVKFISCEQIHLKVQFILLIINTNSIKTVKTDKFEHSIASLQVKYVRIASELIFYVSCVVRHYS